MKNLKSGLVFLVSTLAVAASAIAGESTREVPAYAHPTADLESAIKVGRVPESVVQAARKAGEVHVIVQLNLKQPFRVESELNESDAEAQRRAIAASQDAVSQRILGLTPKESSRMRYIPYMSLWGDERTLTELVRAPEVRRLEEDTVYATHLASSTAVVGSAAVQTALGPQQGAGQAIAILDTGVDLSHSFFGGRVISEACYSDGGGWFSSRDSICPNGREATTAAGTGVPCPVTGCDHGTHVAGIAAGLDDGISGASGVADGATLISIQVFHRQNDSGTCQSLQLSAPCPLTSKSDVIKGLERVYELRNRFDIAAANLSLGGGFFNSRQSCDDANDSYRDIVATLWGSNIATVASSGNGAAIVDPNTNRILRFQSGIAAPACVTNVISVGSVNDLDALAPTSQFSSLTTLLATGVSIRSSVPGNAYGNKNGTSMAAPHVTGAVAVLAALNPAQSVTALRNRLVATGKSVTDTRNNPSIVTPRLQLDAAVEAQMNRPLPPSGVAQVWITGSEVRVSWSDNSRSAATFKVLAEPLNLISHPPRRATVNASFSSATVQNLTSDLDYDVTVQACNAAGNCSAPSSPLRVRTLYTLPDPPANVRVGTVTTDSIEIQWDDQSVNPVSYFRIGHNTLGSWFYQQRAASARSIVFNNLSHDTFYQFWVEAYNASGPSGKVYINARTVSLGPPPAAPSNLHVCGTQSFEFCFTSGTMLVWRDNANDETRYEFEWAQATGGVPGSQAVFTSTALAANSRSHALTLNSGTLYYFRVRACNAAGCSAYSNTVNYGVP